ncbi:enolase C-terminal domain-like protein [Salmonella enterica subsp. enterica serovar Typhimurium]
MRSVKVYEETWPLHTPFVIARGSRSEAHVVVVELEEEDVKGIGECTPYPRYGESDASVMAQIMSIVPQLENGLTREALQKLLPAGAARNAVDSALWDLQARQRQQSLAGLLAARCQLLADLNVAMLEQPLPAQDDAALENFIHPLPICADESCHTRSSLKALTGRYDMINIKLDKTGGLTEALALATEAREQGFGLMLGCMLCTSRAISAALPLMPQVSFADLDGPTWLAVDVEPALRFTTGQLHL